MEETNTQPEQQAPQPEQPQPAAPSGGEAPPEPKALYYVLSFFVSIVGIILGIIYMKKDGEGDLWAGISLSNARTEGESYGNYRERLKTIKELEKVYKKLGREECHKQFPNGFAYAIYISRQEELEKRNKMINKK